jgi:HlyD family secretion protein
MAPPVKSTRPRRLLIAGALLAVLAIAYVAFRRPAPLVLTGIVTTDEVIVSPQIQGRIDRLLVREGDAVRRGQLLAVLAPDEMRAEFDYYASSARQAEAQVTQATADLQYQTDLTVSQTRQAEAVRASAEAQVAAAGADLENAQIAFRRETELHASGADSESAYDAARTGLASAQARLESARRQAAAAEAAVATARANLSQVQVRSAILAGDVSSLAAFNAQKQKAQVRLGYTELHAPIDGIVDVRAARPGEVVAPGQAVVTLVNPDDLWIRADVEEGYVDGIRLGDTLTVRLPSGAELPGTVFFRGADADYATQRDVSRTKRDIRTFEIRLRCDNRDRRLAVGMTAYVLMPVRRR